MSYIAKRAENFVIQYIKGGINEYENVIQEAKDEIYNLDEDADKILFLNIILEQNELEFAKHLKGCQNKKGCQTNFAHESISYYLNQELRRLGVKKTTDQFTTEEKVNTEDFLNKILADLQTLKDGQEIIFDELSELKDLYFVGKKNWRQLLIGKLSDMTIGGIISETVSKDILSAIGEEIKRLNP